MPQSLSEFLYADEAFCVERLLDGLTWDANRAEKVENEARQLVERVRKSKRRMGELETFLQKYGLNTEEGLALMTLAEALLRIPDTATADLLIKDKMKAAEWLAGQGSGGGDLLTKAAGLGLSLTRKTLDSGLARLGGPVIRKALVEAMRMLGRQFVLGRTIEEGVKNARAYGKKGYRLSYDMLGEAARTAEDAERYFEIYRHAIDEIGRSAGTHTGANGPDARPGISVKLSALYPRYEYRQAEYCIPALTEKLMELSQQAASRNITLTVDAEEADRLAMSLDIIQAVYADESLKHWDGFGLAIQAYQKRAYPLVRHLADMAQAGGKRLRVRLVKGAYWDTEIKRAQVLGLPDYPVFTRKVNSDLSFLRCADEMLARRDVFFPMFATHNAHTIAGVAELAGAKTSDFEFQRLHGMGETIYNLVLQDKLAPVCVYAPCGSHEDLLPYLVRRLLENGANSSFVNKLLDPDVPAEAMVADPVGDARNHPAKRHPKIPLPRAIYPARTNSAGMDLTEKSTVEALLPKLHEEAAKKREAAPLIGGRAIKEGKAAPVTNPADSSEVVGEAWTVDEALIGKAFETARQGFTQWSQTPAEERAAALERLADLMEEHCEELMAICIKEAGKTIDDAVAEVREAVDFCRYYAMRGRLDFAVEGQVLPGPTGESNRLTLHARGIFVCISPWNFPLAIFTGQVTAALMAGNAVIAKPASPTPLIAMRAVELMHQAGIAPAAINLLPGSGKMGAEMVAHRDVAGVSFTGSTGVAWQINRTLAAKDGPIVPLIAETGGQNAMIVDSSALTEQVVDDVLISAFGSAGQRCSALRVLYVQEEVADRTIEMLKGAMAERRVGDPIALSSDIGPAIDQKSKETLAAHRAWLDENARFIAEVPVDEGLKEKGHFFAPVAYEIESIKELEREVFGPVLHIVRFKSDESGQVISDINSTGYGLTLGVHSRISSTTSRITCGACVGNAYVNRTMIGAVVGVQPFGGEGLSGTGPKAGGPHYLPRFATERVVSVDTTRQGGNASLVSLEE